jgi:hypothetical protein
MKTVERRLILCAAGILAMAGVCVSFMPAGAQTSPPQGGKAPVKVAGSFDKAHVLPAGGPTPRMADGHPDLSGRWYPNSAGRMLQYAYNVDPLALQQFDPAATPEATPSFKPGVDPKYLRQVAYGDCDVPGTPSVTLEQMIQHGPMELVQTPQRLAMLYEYPLGVRMIYANGRVHPKDPDPTFSGDSTAHWEGDTLVIDVIAIDERARVISGVGGGGGQGSGIQWFPSEKEHVIERFSRPSRNYLIYQVTIEDPLVLAKPWTSAPRRWSLAEPNDEWTEFFCTNNEEPGVWKKMQELGLDAPKK